MKTRVGTPCVGTPCAELIIIGREIVSGLRRDTNTSVIADRLTAMGFYVERVTVIPDEDRVVVAALGSATADLVVVTGGLGSARDDLTRPALARFAHSPLVEDETMKKRLIVKLARRNSHFTARHAAFIERPAIANPLRNPVGLAEGLWIETASRRSQSSRHRRIFCALPGVPVEMEAILGGDFEKMVRRRFSHLVPARRRVIGIAGMRESQVEDLFLDRPEFQKGAVCILPSPGIVHLVMPPGPLAALAGRRLGDAIFTRDGRRLEEVVVASLVKNGETIAVAESCTGGELGAAITNVPGSSAAFLGGVIAYANRVKEKNLGVSHSLIARHGAVSMPVATAMARGIRRRMHSTWGLAITGVAGPSGGTKEKPVGTVCIALAGPGVQKTETFHFGGTRAMIRTASARSALDLLRRTLLRRE